MAENKHLVLVTADPVTSGQMQVQIEGSTVNVPRHQSSLANGLRLETLGNRAVDILIEFYPDLSSFDKNKIQHPNNPVKWLDRPTKQSETREWRNTSLQHSNNFRVGLSAAFLLLFVTLLIYSQQSNATIQERPSLSETLDWIIPRLEESDSYRYENCWLNIADKEGGKLRLYRSFPTRGTTIDKAEADKAVAVSWLKQERLEVLSVLDERDEYFFEYGKRLPPIFEVYVYQYEDVRLDLSQFSETRVIDLSDAKLAIYFYPPQITVRNTYIPQKILPLQSKNVQEAKRIQNAFNNAIYWCKTDSPF